MVLQVSTANDVAIYSITSAGKSSIPDWLASQKKTALRHDDDYRRRIELIQDFDFPEASLRIQITPDGRNVVATGTYKPQMRVFELNDLSMKFVRNTDAETVQFQLLSQDWTKVLLLQSDRTIEFHTQAGLHFKTRIPKFGRDIAYHFPSCDVLAVGASSEAFRINLERGQFMSPIATDCSAINVCAVNPAHHLFGFGGEDGTVEFWHPSTRKRIGGLNIAAHLAKSIEFKNAIPEVSSLKFAEDGLSFAIGTSTGHVLLYDLRNPSPIIVKDHQYGYPIKSIDFHTSGKIISSDTKIVKIWDKDSGKVFTNIEPPNDINEVTLNQGSGLLMVANEGTKVQSYYIPALGPAPAWCPFLDNLTEELEENPTQTIYDDYKFLTKKELLSLNLSHLVGTAVLKAYMHGFFIDLRLYEKAKAIANPFDYEDFKKSQVIKKIEKQRATRISSTKQLPKVNVNLAKVLLDGEEGLSKKKKGKRMEGGEVTGANPTGDDRFRELFVDEAFQVDEDDVEYKLRHPAKAEEIDSSEGEVVQVKPAVKKVSHPLMEEKVDMTKEMAFGTRVVGIEKQRKHERMSSNSHGNSSVTFALPRGKKFVERDTQNDIRKKRDGDDGDVRKKRGVGQLRLPKN